MVWSISLGLNSRWIFVAEFLATTNVKVARNSPYTTQSLAISRHYKKELVWFPLIANVFRKSVEHQTSVFESLTKPSLAKKNSHVKRKLLNTNKLIKN